MSTIEQAVKVLQRDGIVVYPTETVYGLGADALSEDAVMRIYEAKGRPLGKPISIAVSDEEMLRAVAVVDGEAEAFIRRFLPGPVTVVLPAKSCLPELLTGGTGLIGIRMPAHETALRIIEALDAPITATSANLADEAPVTRPEDVDVAYDILVDGGELPGTPSTVVDLTTRTILRKGKAWEDVEAYLRGQGESA
ncbi:threonylcarbamoyl-AMP synthase [Methanoculleus sp. FWC-SCC1]|uniref:L-threonylcarbamoyladenylate synthase n=1 Tax=Methanoculleus frigidifontis TaxID=2584085 RepID=A0ABT8M9E0_9EURY|nr:L-threonylcarbamoyladenylate synthase [Methanoculleus sp. FWC-SCC1]MDN7024552.1 threonylcarbamoyl-AMP synthase [Methanoculleus sp. FWC-SCC1]